MALSVGIVGLPNVGKSTIFNALTAAGAESANYPFCTIDPNVGVVAVPDERLYRIQKHIPTERVIPASVDIVDIAGLVKGAAQGEGLGNKFLANIRETDAILMVVRCFDDENVVHVDGSVDPLRDIEVIELELIFADLDTAQKRVKRAQAAAKTGKAEGKAELAFVEGLIAHLEKGRPARSYPCESEELATIRRDMHLLTVKPVLYCCNVGEDEVASGNAYVEKVRARAASEGAEVVVVCGKIEEELRSLEGEDLAEMLGAYGLTEPALNKLIRGCYTLLGLQSYFTAGEKEIRAWTIPVGATAPQAAGVIHTDFERGFIRANVYTLADLEQYHDEAAIRSAGKLRSEGKEYVMRDGDIVHFLFNV
ncbi:MAG: redox-regulated ATPase YchF [Myxococcales bacterium]|nr:redox-regulated ATPase YchF [Myxococcales bacterium]